MEEIRSLTFYVNRALFDKEGQEISVTADDDTAITILGGCPRITDGQRRSNA
jgi:hypothetical protein